MAPKKRSSTPSQGAPKNNGVAVVGMSCWFPGARSPLQLWENVAASRRELRRIPAKRIPQEGYFSTDPASEDTFYQAKAGVIDGFTFDWARYRIPKNTYLATDVAQWLALDTARRALSDAGLEPGQFERDRVGAFVGNTDTGDQMRAFSLRLRWPFVRRALAAASRSLGVTEDAVDALAERMEQYYKSPFPAVNEDFGAGNIAATIAGRICNYFDLHGGAYVIDGACASAMVAVHNACDMLTHGSLDLAVAGGVDISIDPWELVAFSKAGALSQTDMTPFDRRGSGFITAEGCGFVVLKRLEDALAAKDEIYGVIRGWGMSSDGRGGIMQPTPAGQALAIRRALTRAGMRANELRFVEGHGTGTRAGDKAELMGLTQVLKEDGVEEPNAVGIGSIKSIMGHAKAAAGIASLIKVVCAVNRRVVPPTAACEQPHPLFESAAQSLYPIRMGEQVEADERVSAGVSSFGFGGINVHVVVESPQARPSTKLVPAVPERALFASRQESELFVFHGTTRAELLAKIAAAEADAAGLSAGDLTDLAASLTAGADTNRYRAAVVCGDPTELSRQLRTLREELETRVLEGKGWSNPEQTLWAGNTGRAPRLGFLFPGQGSQHLGMARFIVERYDWAQALVQQADGWVQETGGEPISGAFLVPTERASQAQLDAWTAALAETQRAQPAIVLATLLVARLMERLGLRPSAVGGHSLGELTAFHAAGAFDARSLLQLAVLRGRAMAGRPERKGAMASIACPREKAESLTRQAGGQVVVANVNSPRQVVISGEERSVEEVIRLASEAGMLARRLPVSNAFHSPLVESAAKQMERVDFLPPTLGPLHVELLSGVGDPEVEVEVRPGGSLTRHFAKQVTAPVEFVRLLRELRSRCDLMLEVGPGKVLTGLVRDTFEDGASFGFATCSSPGSFRDFNTALAAAFCAGCNIKWPVLYQSRLVRPYVPLAQRVFIESLTEKPFPDLADEARAPLALTERAVARAPARAEVTPPAQVAAVAPAAPAPGVEQALMELIARRTGYPAESIRPQSKLLDDLNIDSIKAGELIGAACRQAGVVGKVDPSQYLNGTVQQVADAIRAAGPIAAAAPAGPSVTPVTAPSAAASVSGAQAQGDGQEVVMQLIVERTGYDKSTVRPQSKLLDDLNIDSIKAGEIVAAAAKAWGVSGKLDASSFANSTVADIAQALCRARDERARSAPAAAADAPHSLKVLTEELEALTGFPRSNIEPDARLHHDLSLDEPKLRTLVQRFFGRLGMEATIDIRPLLERTVRQLAAIADGRSATDGAATARVAETAGQEAPGWLRTFAVGVRRESVKVKDVPTRRTEDDWAEADVGLAFEPEEADFAAAVEAQLIGLGGRVHRVSFGDLRGREPTAELDYSHIIAILPRGAKVEPDPEKRYLDAFGRLLSVARPQRASRAPRRRTTLAFVQFGGGTFGHGETVPEVSAATSLGFARSLHLERTDLRVRVVDFSPGVNPDTAASLVLQEVRTPDGFGAAGYDAQLKRWVPSLVLQRPAEYRPRPFTLSENDVVLVTGGGKGVMAECALEAARVTGATLVLMGTSRPPSADDRSASSVELARTLERFQQEGLKARYYACDVTDAAAVESTLARVRAEIGPITAVVHGAVILRGARAEHQTEPAALKELAPKVLGVENLCRALEEHPPKLFVGFTSVSQQTGVPGNCVYTFSSDAMELVLRRFGQRHPQTQIQCIGWGVWSDVGWGARADNMAKLDYLQRAGLAYQPFRAADGVKRFAELLTHDPGTDHVLVTSRVAGFDTWAQSRAAEARPAAGWRYLERVQHYEPGVELVVRTKLTLERDQYLRDHVFRGMYVLPTVFGLEMLAQAASAVAGQGTVVRLENVEMPWPVTVDAEAGVEVELRALVREPREASGELCVDVSLRSEQTGFTKDAVLGTVVLGARRAAPAAERPQDAPLPIEPLRDLYGRHFFVGPLFQRMQQVLSVAPERMVTLAERKWGRGEPIDGFSANARGPMLLGDPYLRDTLLHTAMFHDLRAFSFTARIGSIELFDEPAGAPGPVYCIARRLSQDKLELLVDLEVRDAQGAVVERMSNYAFRVVSSNPDLPTAAELQDPAQMEQRDQALLERTVAKAQELWGAAPTTVGLAVSPGLKRRNKKDRHQFQKAFARRLLSGKSGGAGSGGATEVEWLPSGAPVRRHGDQEAGVSFSMTDPYCAVVLGDLVQGCDLEAVQPREDWAALLGDVRMPLVRQLMDGGDRLEVAGTRVWTALEAARKATQAEKVELSFKERKDAYVLLTAKPAEGAPVELVTAPVSLTRAPDRVFAWVVTRQAAPAAAPRHDAATAAPPAQQQPGAVRDEARGCDVVFQRFTVPWRQCGTLGKTVAPVQFVGWFKDLCELMLEQEAGKWFLEGVREGTLGGVTRNTELQLHSDVTAYDVVELRVWVAQLNEGSVVWAGECEARLPSGGSRKVATFRSEGAPITGRGGPGGATSVPERLKQVYRRYLAKSPVSVEGPPKADPGQPLLRNPRGEAPISVEQIKTTPLESDVMGNINNAHYFGWQQQVRDLALHQARDLSSNAGPSASRVECARTSVQYLRELFPYEQVSIEMSVEAVFEKSATLHFEYFRLLEDGGREKVAVGSQEVVWVEQTGRDAARVSLWPESMLRRLGVTSDAQLGLGGHSRAGRTGKGVPS